MDEREKYGLRRDWSWIKERCAGNGSFGVTKGAAHTPMCQEGSIR